MVWSIGPMFAVVRRPRAVFIPATCLLFFFSRGLFAEEALADARIEKAAGPGIIHSIEDVPYTRAERNKGRDRNFILLADRYEYHADEPLAQFIAALDCPDVRSSRLVLRLERDGVEQASYSGTVGCARVGFLVDVGRLKPGAYKLSGRFESEQAGKRPEASFTFTKTNESGPVKTWPDAGLPLGLQDQHEVADAQWPTHASVPVPRGALHPDDLLALTENGQAIPAQIETVATWDKTKVPKWLHVYFVGRYDRGKPGAYVLQKSAKQTPSSGKPLTVTDLKDRIVVDTGAMRFEVRRPFAGISRAWFDPTGQGKYDQSVIEGDHSGPYVIHEKEGSFAAADDSEAEVTLETAGSVMAVIKAEGWYRQPGAQGGGRFCRFVTRFRVYAGQALIEVQHSTIFTTDMSKNRIRDLGFRLPTVAGESFGLGMDGRTVSGDFVSKGGPQEPSMVSLHQERPDRCRILGQAPQTGKRSDGWFFVRSASAEKVGPANQRALQTGAVQPGGVQTSLLVKDIWQKYPKEVELGRDSIVFHAWPRHGRRTYEPAEELGYDTFYKLRCFHQGELLDLKLPASYVDVIRKQNETKELRPEWAEAANASGLAITNEFAIKFSKPMEGAGVAAWRRLLELDPLATPDPAWSAASGVFGPIAERGGDFPEIEQTIEDGLLGFSNMDRIQVYGQLLYGNVHHSWIPSKNRANLHRVWLNNHYHTASLPWILFMRSDSRPMLRWARINVDNYASIGQVRYDSFEGPPAENGTKRPTFQAHYPGGFYHCKSHVPWGGEAYGMKEYDTHCGPWGHWCDPDALLYAYLIDDNRWARDGYDLWLRAIREYTPIPVAGSAREINTTLSRALVAYDYTHDPSLLPAIGGMAAGLRSRPLASQRPGALWEPLWCARYFEQSRDPAYVKFIVDSARENFTSSITYSLSLSAQAYAITGDRNFLFRYATWIDDAPRRLYKEFTAEDGKRHPTEYNNYGLGPGPLGDRFLCFQWPRFKAQLRKAGISALQRVDESGDYPHGASRYDSAADPRGCRVYVLETEDRAWPITLDAHSVGGGDMHKASIRLTTPSGRQSMVSERFPAGDEAKVFRTSGRPASRKQWMVPADGETGLYQIQFTASRLGIFSPLTPLPEAAVIQNNRISRWKEPVLYRAVSSRGYLLPLASDPIEITVAPETDLQPMRLSITDGRGRLSVLRSLLKSRPGDSVTKTMGPSPGLPGPWLIDIYSDGSSPYQLTAAGPREDELLLFGSKLQDLQRIRKALHERSLKRDPNAVE